VIAALAPTILVGGGVLLLMAATLAAKVTRINLLIRGVADPALLWLATVLAAVVHRTVGGLAVAYLASYVALFALAWAGAARVFGRGRLVQALRAAPLPGFARFALPLGVSGLMSSLLPRLNVFILGSVGGATQVAVFAAAEELGRSVVGVRYAFDNVVSPMLSEALRSGDRQRARYVLRLTTRWVTSAAAPIAVTLFVLRSDLLALYGPGFSSGILAMALLLLGHLINSVLGLTGHALLMIGRSDVFFWDNAAVTALHLLLSLALVPRMGVTGAAIASLSSALAMQLLLLAQVSRLVRISPFDRALVKPLLAAAVTLVVELLVARAPLPSLPRALAIAIAGACVYGATLMAVRPGDEERQFVLRMLGRLRGRAPVKPAPAEPEKLKSAQAGK
jgi:O-antigen/teichoic acid export membrane protein